MLARSAVGRGRLTPDTLPGIMLHITLGLLLSSFICQGITATRIGGLNDEPTGAWALTQTDKLRRHLLPGYDRWVRPAEVNESTPVKFSLTPTHIFIDEVKSTSTLIGWMKLMWHDGKLRWNASDYGNVDVIRVSSDEIWKPDIELYNVALKPAAVGTQANILVFPDGAILWVPPVRFDVQCKLNLKSWPRDTQTCRFVFGSWTYHTLIVDFTFDKEGYEKIEHSWESTHGGHWKIKQIQTNSLIQHYNCCIEPYTSLQYDITVERLGSGHAIINEVPVIALAVLLLAAALREPGSRGLLLISVVIVSSIYLVSHMILFPNFGDITPRIFVMYCGLLILAAIWGVTSAIAERLSNNEKTTVVPGALRRFVKKSKLNVASEEDGVAMAPESEKEPAPAADSLRDSWKELSKLFDRVFLAVGALGFALLVVLSF